MVNLCWFDDYNDDDNVVDKKTTTTCNTAAAAVTITITMLTDLARIFNCIASWLDHSKQQLKGHLHDRQKCTDPLKSGRVPIIYVKKYPYCFGSIGVYGPKKQRYFFTKITGTVPLVNGSVPFFTCCVNSPLISPCQWLKQSPIHHV